MPRTFPRFTSPYSTRLLAILWLVIVFATLCNPSQSSAQVRVTNVNDITFGTWPGSGDLQTMDDICIYNAAIADYQITVDGAGPGGAYLLNNGGHTLAYQVEFRGGAGWVTLAPGVPQNFTGANLISDTCAGGTNASIRITVPENNLLAAYQGSYSGNISILVSP